jgi:nucleoside phosphorylase
MAPAGGRSLSIWLCSIPAQVAVVAAAVIASAILLAPGLRTAAGATTPVVGGSHIPAGCTTSHVLLLGSYPSEVSANLQREKLSPDQPTVIDGIDFYVGTLAGRHVVTAIAGPAPSVTYATTVLALRHFPCTSAVVFSGTAGGGGATGLGDVAVPGAWTDDNGATFTPVSSAALAVAEQVQKSASEELAVSAAVDDGVCLCQGQAQALQVVPLLRTPQVVVGGHGTTYGGQSLFCLADGGMLEGCNPCPPSSGTAAVEVNLPVAVGTSSNAEAQHLSLETSRGALVPDAWSLLAHVAAPPPTESAIRNSGTTTAGTSYIADDEQTTGAQQAADANHVPFIAFRGISDTSAVGNLWPFEWLVYQQLAADNSATAARLWIESWSSQ